jgi:hypothetical protein
MQSAPQVAGVFFSLLLLVQETADAFLHLWSLQSLLQVRVAQEGDGSEGWVVG